MRNRLEALITEREGMIAQNLNSSAFYREPIYVEKHFNVLAEKMRDEAKIKVRVPPGCCIPGTAKRDGPGSIRKYDLALTEMWVDAEFVAWSQCDGEPCAIIRLPDGQIDTCPIGRVVLVFAVSDEAGKDEVKR